MRAEVRGWLSEALREGDDRHDITDIEAGIEDGDYALVEGVHTAIVLEIVRYPRRKILRVFLAGGETGKALPELIAKLPWLHRMARDLGATLELQGRRGWLRTLQPHGWREAFVTMIKE